MNIHFFPQNSHCTQNSHFTQNLHFLSKFTFLSEFTNSLFTFVSDRGVDVSEVVGSGPSLAFIAFPEAIAKMDHMGTVVPPLMSFLFFFMILTLGLDSMFTMIETLTTAILDQFRALRAVKGNSIFQTSKKKRQFFT